MNDKIKQLVKQSQPKIDWEARHYGELNNGEKLDYQNQWFEKFAELIVKECCQIVLDCSIPGSNNERDFVVTAREIKQHFGVE